MRMNSTVEALRVTDTLWAQLLELKTRCDRDDAPGDILAFGGQGFRFLSDAAAVDVEQYSVLFAREEITVPGGSTITILDDELYAIALPSIDPGILQVLRLYVPLAAAPFYRPDRSFVLVHMATTLDGRVATESGSSQWIGNEANLLHAHRVRALVDGVLVGGNTARRDLPSLNVRHVAGENPARIILSNSFDKFASLPGLGDIRTILVRSAAKPTPEPDASDITVVEYAPGEAATESSGLLASLAAVGVHSILIEGGPLTFRSFLVDGAVDWLQVHVAPMIFGSGNSLVSLPVIDDVDDALRLRHAFQVQVGDEFMVTGQL